METRTHFWFAADTARRDRYTVRGSGFEINASGERAPLFELVSGQFAPRNCICCSGSVRDLARSRHSIGVYKVYISLLQ